MVKRARNMTVHPSLIGVSISNKTWVNRQSWANLQLYRDAVDEIFERYKPKIEIKDADSPKGEYSGILQFLLIFR